MLALFALFCAGSRAQAQSGNQLESSWLKARIETQGLHTTKLKALVVQQARELQSQQRIAKKPRQGHHADLTAVALPSRSTANDRRESAHLMVNRIHAPPQTNRPFAEVHSGFEPVQSHGLYSAGYSDHNLTEPAPGIHSQPNTLRRYQTASTIQPASKASASARDAARGDFLGAQQSQPISENHIPHSPLQFQIGSAYFTPFGFLDFTSVWRNHDTGNGIATNFASIPYGANSVQTNLSELRFSSQNSRIGFRVDALVKDTQLIGYMESDFLGSSPGNLAVSTNSNTPRMRLYWVDLMREQWELLAGQSWSLIPPHRVGISPVPANIFYTQNIDSDYAHHAHTVCKFDSWMLRG